MPKNKFSFHKDLHIASLEAKSTYHQLKVHTLIQDTSQKQPSINAFLGARYSRSADSVVDIAKEVMNKGQDAAKRLESIFYGYGHKSVGDMADLFLCLENVPMITAMRLFNINPVLAGQERSTRFQNFEKPAYIGLPEGIGSSELRQSYDAIINGLMKSYLNLLEPTRVALAQHFEIDEDDKSQVGALTARTFDTARYFLPMGLQTSLGFVMSARSWSELISQLSASGYHLEQKLAQLIHELLTPTEEALKTGYLPEADGLIRHTAGNPARSQSTQEILSLMSKNFAQNETVTISRKLDRNLNVKLGVDPTESLLRHYQLLAAPLSPQRKINLSKSQVEKVAEIVFTHHNHHRQLGPIGQNGSIAIEGFADFGVLKDLNRHRSLERFVPIWNDNHNLDNELERESVQCFFVCNYLHIPKLIGLKKEYEKRLTKTYDEIKKWYQLAKQELSPEMAREYCTYLLPHAHATRYRFYGSIDDLQYTINLRSRNGGHIAYRSLVYSWLKKLAQKDVIWQSLLKQMPEVLADSREQFIDRS